MMRSKGLLFIVTQARRPRVKKCVSAWGLHAVRKAKGQEFAQEGTQYRTQEVKFISREAHSSWCE